MGFFKTIKNAQKAAAKGVEIQQKYEAQTAAADQPVDLNDPKWVPIHGITCDKYAEISAGLQKHSVMGVDKVNEYAEAAGVPQGKWSEVQIGWTQRMQQHQEVSTRYGIHYSKYLS